MSVPHESPEEVTQRIPRVPAGPSSTAHMPPVDIGQFSPAPGQPQYGWGQQQYPPPPPPQQDQRPGGGRRGLVVKGIGLLGVAVLSGLLYLALKPTTTPQDLSTPQKTVPEGEFEFAVSASVPEPRHDTDCAANAYTKTQEYLRAKPCEELIRALYTTTTDDGRKVYTSISIVKMKTVEDAVGLKNLTTQDDTGNVNDLIKQGVASVPGLTTLGNGGYASQQVDREVVIIESDAVQHVPDEPTHNALMKRISNDAFRLTAEMKAE
ncbi:hypothetical protein [Umezawaea beigongshangensis]|uniref:hypothetical protein n=1 Tax=Umezawaea beigongshangensis TaxID=2780383 RepID=UPI0018F19DB2|nr:hypothetical protein [Umezawaea beigongshangensis]